MWRGMGKEHNYQNKDGDRRVRVGLGGGGLGNTKKLGMETNKESTGFELTATYQMRIESFHLKLMSFLGFGVCHGSYRGKIYPI